LQEIEIENKKWS